MNCYFFTAPGPTPNKFFYQSPEQQLAFYARRAWQYVSGQTRSHSSPLVVLNAADLAAPLPCSTCETNCCKMHKGHGGFDSVAIMPWEEIAKRHPGLMLPSPETPGQFTMRFVDGQCPHLGPKNRCSIYEYRPVACRHFRCAEGLRDGTEVNTEYTACAAQYLRLFPGLMNHKQIAALPRPLFQVTIKETDAAEPQAKTVTVLHR